MEPEPKAINFRGLPEPLNFQGAPEPISFQDGGVQRACLGTVSGTMCTFIPAAIMRKMLTVPTKPGAKTNCEPLKSMDLGVDIVVHDHSSGKAEVHSDWDDVWEGIDGHMRFVLNGQLDPNTKKEVKPGEFRADSIIGGREVILGPGDQLIIPAGEPHQNMCLYGVAKAGIVKRPRKSLLDEAVKLREENAALKAQVAELAKHEPPEQDTIPF